MRPERSPNLFLITPYSQRIFSLRLMNKFLKAPLLFLLHYYKGTTTILEVTTLFVTEEGGKKT